MPLDPNIILQSTPTPTPFQQYGQLLQLRNAQQQGQLQQAQLQGANLQNQEQQIQLNAEQTLDKAYQSAFTTGDDGNPSLNQDKLSSYLAQNGAGHLLPQVMKGFTDMKKSAADAVKANADAQTANADLAGSAAAGVRDAGYDPNILIAKVAYLDKQGAIPHAQAVQTTAQVQQIVQQNQGNPDAVKTAVKALVDPLIAASPAQRKLDAEQLTAQGAAQRGAAAQTEAGLKQEQADTQRAANVLVPALAKGPQAYQQVLATLPPAIQAKFVALGPNPTQQAIARVTMTGEQQTQADQAAANAAEAAKRDRQTAQYQAGELGQGQQRIGIEQARLRLAQNQAAGGPNPLAGRSDADLARLKAIANGDIPAPPARSPSYKSDMDAVLALDPTYTESRYKGVQQFKTGADANNLVMMTTALAHLDRATTNSQALGFSPTQSWNITPEQRRYSADVDLLTGEIGKLVKNGVVTEGEADRLTGNLKSMVQGNRAAALDELKTLMTGKIEGISQKFKNSTGRNVPRTFFDPATQQRMAKYGIGEDSGIASGSASGPAPGAPAAAAPSSPAAPTGLQHMSTDDLFKALNK